MPAGISILNTAGSVIIDETYSNFFVRTKGTVSIGNATKPAWANGAGIGYFSISCTADAPLVALCPGALCSLHYSTRSGANWTFYYWCATSSGSVEYFVFDKTQNAPATTDNCGLQVFDAAGNKVFDSAKGSGRVQTFQTLTFDGNDFTTSFTYDGSRKYAFVDARAVRGFLATNPEIGATIGVAVGARYDGSGTVTFGRIVTNSGVVPAFIGQTGYRGPTAVGALILDVTAF